MAEENSLDFLQNGSDIRGIAITTDKHEANLTRERVEAIARGFVTWLKEKTNASGEQPLRIAIGRDSRLSGPEIMAALLKGMQGYPVEVLDCGMATTPAMFMATLFEDFQVDGSIMITASHLPFEYNGLKFFTKTGGAEKSDITRILDLAAERTPAPEKNEQFTVVEKDLLTAYAADLVAKIRKGIPNSANPDQPLSGRHIIVDAGNGAGGFFAEKVLVPLGADVTGSQFLDPDGHFPNHEPNPDNKEAMRSLREAVLREGADLGIIFDTDVDRSALVDDSGQAFNRNNLIALISAVLLKENPGATIVTNSATSSHLQHFLEGLGGRQDRYLTGYRNVINRAIELNEAGTNAVLAIETSGHAALKENYFLDDGAYLIAKLLMADAQLLQEQQKLADLIADLGQPAETTEYRFTIVQEPVFERGNSIIERFKEHVSGIEDLELVQDHLEGARVNFSGRFGQGWFILRMSLHEPLLVWTIESDEPGKITELVEALMPFFLEQEDLDRENIIKK